MPGTPTRNTNALRSNACSHPASPCWANWTISAIASMSGPTMNGHWSTTKDFNDRRAGGDDGDDGVVAIAMTTTYPSQALLSQVHQLGLADLARFETRGARLHAADAGAVGDDRAVGAVEHRAGSGREQHTVAGRSGHGTVLLSRQRRQAVDGGDHLTRVRPVLLHQPCDLVAEVGAPARDHQAKAEQAAGEPVGELLR